MPAAAERRWPFVYHWVYSAKFLCGEVKPSEGAVEQPVEGGRYATAINVHNPGIRPVPFRKKAVLLFDGSRPDEAVERPLPPGKPITRELPPDYGLEIDCRDIRRVLLRGIGGPQGPPPPTFIKGWVVIETLVDVPLDVVAVYTTSSLAAPPSQAPSIAVDRVSGTRLLRQLFAPGGN
jgi:hypothetical protein